MTCKTYHVISDDTETLAQCDQCQERHYFKSPYFAKNWANAHAYNDPHLIRNALKYAQHREDNHHVPHLPRRLP